MTPICEGLREVGNTVTQDSCFGIKVDDKNVGSHFQNKKKMCPVRFLV